MDRQEYIDNLIDYYQNPRNRGKIDDPDATMTGGNPGCGDIVTMYVKVREGQAEEVRFEGQGCTISQAGASIVAEMTEGKSLEEIEAVDADELIDLMGREVVFSRVRCATVGIGTLKAAIQDYRRQQIMNEL